MSKKNLRQCNELGKLLKRLKDSDKLPKSDKKFKKGSWV